MRIEPLGDRIVVKRIPAETMKNGIHIPESAQEKKLQAEVVAVGPGLHEDGKRIPCELKAGDRVQLIDWTGTEIQVDGEDVLVLRESEIVGKIETARAAHK